VQGPRALELLNKLTDHNIFDIERFAAAHVSLVDVPMVIGRTGYTGEDGVELYFGDEHARRVWNALLDAGVEHDIETAPIGLAARDSLRFEPGFALYGHEISDDINPLEARLAWAIDFDKDFVGKEALERIKAEGVERKLVTFVLLDKGVPRKGYPVLNAEGENIGEVVTGMYAPTADVYAGNALVDARYAATDTPIHIEIRNKPKAARVVQRPLYRPAYR
ncbi:MAG: glycine cleavage system aminomethyltransferase GcvT, partial [Acidimicrobiia bacterium]|nr:glycine cleavage system aminomethyltransferase GcvT [Acidimicrobiia bacterium]